MTDREIDQLLAADGAGCGMTYDEEAPVIPAPRSGKSFIWWAEDQGYGHGCLDSATGQ